MGENHGGMAVNNRPFNLEMDCWIGKNRRADFGPETFELSTNHLHYNQTAIDSLMKKPFVKIGIAREPKSHFISSYNFYHNLMPKLSYRLNPTAHYNIAKVKNSLFRQHARVRTTDRYRTIKTYFRQELKHKIL